MLTHEERCNIASIVYRENVRQNAAKRVKAELTIIESATWQHLTQTSSKPERVIAEVVNLFDTARQLLNRRVNAR